MDSPSINFTKLFNLRLFSDNSGSLLFFPLKTTSHLNLCRPAPGQSQYALFTLFCGRLFVTSLRDNKGSSTPSLVLVTLVTSSLSPLDHFLLILLPYPEELHHSLPFPYFLLGDLICSHDSNHCLSTALLCLSPSARRSPPWSLGLPQGQKRDPPWVGRQL